MPFYAFDFFVFSYILSKISLDHPAIQQNFQVNLTFPNICVCQQWQTLYSFGSHCHTIKETTGSKEILHFG